MQQRRTRDGFELPKNVNDWIIDLSKTNIREGADRATFCYRKQIKGGRYEIYVEDEGDGVFGGVVEAPVNGPHVEPLDSFTSVETLREAYKRAKEWMETENFVNTE